MNAFSGPQGKGAMRQRREWKRFAAEDRNAQTPHTQTRAHRERCDETSCDLLHEIFTEVLS